MDKKTEDIAMRIALGTFLSEYNINDMDNIIEQMENESADITIWEPFENWSQSELAENICQLRYDIISGFSEMQE